MVANDWFDACCCLRDGKLAIGFNGKGSHDNIGDPAGGDCFIAGEVVGDVESETVHGDPLPDAHPDRGQFPVFNPDAGQSLSALSRDTKFSREINE